jgi:transposase-like protein
MNSSTQSAIKHKQYSPEFKAKVVLAALIVCLAGLTPARWHRGDESCRCRDCRSEEEKKASPESRAALQMELRRLRLEREILKKAAAFFAKEQK